MHLKSWLRLTMIRGDVRLDALRTANGSAVLTQDDNNQRRRQGDAPRTANGFKSWLRMTSIKEDACDDALRTCEWV